jgi:two-component system response regulator YesN
MYTILIVDDKTLIRKGLIKMIHWEALGVQPAGEAENGRKAINMIKKKQPDMVITDIRMPDCDGISLLKEISAEYPDIKTIVISGYDDFEYARAAIKSGSLDYLLKPVDPKELNRAIEHACKIIERDKKLLVTERNDEPLYRPLLSKGQNIFTRDKTSIPQFVNIPIEQFEHTLEANIVSGNPEGIQAVLSDLFDKYFPVKDMSLDSIQLAVSKLCHIIVRLDPDSSRKIQDFLNKTGSQKTLFEFGSIEKIEEVISGFYIAAAEKYREDKNVKYSTSKRIGEFIERNYASDINLSFIAEHFHLNPSYLSSLFKQETGENINECINKTRIENAKRILLAGESRISEIARLTGFSNDNYFYKVFKRVTGLTPGEYQRVSKNP